MKIYKEFKEIAKCNKKIRKLVQTLQEKTDLDGVHIDSAELVTMNKEELSRIDLVDEEYYCDQYQGYLEDDFYGALYYATNVPGQYVRVSFSSY